MRIIKSITLLLENLVAFSKVYLIIHIFDIVYGQGKDMQIYD